jgi:ATP-dependent protease ClpP protease subunit
MSEVSHTPEKLELPEKRPPPPKPPQISGLPMTLDLAQQKVDWETKFQNMRLSMRRQLLSAIQQKRSSKVIAYISKFTLDFTDASMLSDLLALHGKVDRIDLVLDSPGGLIDAAYKIVCLLREYAKVLSVIIPNRAKSAATLIALGADELLMGPPSEIGPIDPMIPVSHPERGTIWIPAQSIRDALKLFDSEIAEDINRSALFMPIMSKIDPWVLGAYERAIKSSEQYAAELLGAYMLKNNQDLAKEIAKNLATGYYSHGYAIDRRITKDKLQLNVTFIDEDQELWSYVWRLFKLYEALLNEQPKTVAIFETVEGTLMRIEEKGNQNE